MWNTARIAAGHYQVARNRQHPAAVRSLRRVDAALYSSTMSVGNLARVIAVLGACLAAAGSATSSSNPGAENTAAGGNTSPPPPQQMEANRALGLWRSTFGAVKIEADNSKGGLDQGNLQGVWVYQRQGQEVVGYFYGNLRGNVMQFRWQEPNNPPLTGEGYLVFDTQGRQYAGRWWSDKRDRVGDWNGWRQTQGQNQQYGGYQYQNQPPPQYGQGQYGGQPYGGGYRAAQPPPYNGQQPQQYPPPQPAYGQPYPPPPSR